MNYELPHSIENLALNSLEPDLQGPRFEIHPQSVLNERLLLPHPLKENIPAYGTWLELATDWLDTYRREPGVDLGLLKEFSTLIAKNYREDQYQAIHTALTIALVAHQYNLNTKKQWRKSDHSPYLFHVVGVAKRLAEKHLPWYVVTTGLLHDTVEDVDLGPALSGKTAWHTLIQSEFSLFNKEEAKLIVDHIEGVTEIDELPESDSKWLQSWTLKKRLVTETKEAMQRNGKTFSQTDSSEIDLTLYNLRHLVQKASSSERHWTLLCVKIADTLENFQTIDFVKPHKLLRGIITVNLAEFLGWHEASSELLERMADRVDLTHHTNRKVGKKSVQLTKDDAYLNDLATGIIQMLGTRIVEMQLAQNPIIPEQIVTGWSTFFTQKETAKKNGKSVTEVQFKPVIRLLFSDDDFSLLTRKLSSNQYYYWWDWLKAMVNGKKVRLLDDYANAWEGMGQILGRKALYAWGVSGTGPQIPVIIGSNTPTMIEAFDKDHPVDLTRVPESALFRGFPESGMRTTIDDEIDTTQAYLMIALLYHHRFAFSHENLPVYSLKVSERLVFLDSTIPLEHYVKRLGLDQYIEIRKLDYGGSEKDYPGVYFRRPFSPRSENAVFCQLELPLDQSLSSYPQHHNFLSHYLELTNKPEENLLGELM